MTRLRVVTSLIMAPLAIAAILLLPTAWFAVLLALLFLAGLWEWLRLAGVEDSLARGFLLLANLGVMVALVWGSRTASGGSLVLFELVTLIGALWWLAALLWLRFYRLGERHDSRARILKLLGGTLAVIPAWTALCWIHASEPYGHRWVLVACFMVWAADTGAYFAGRKFGRHKLAPRISPNKTIEGLAGGVLLAVLVAVLLSLYAGATRAQLPLVAAVALVAVLMSVVGDLYESLLKRHAGVKDSGDLIPGHGGVLDRMDAILAAMPFFALGKAWLGF